MDINSPKVLGQILNNHKASGKPMEDGNYEMENVPLGESSIDYYHVGYTLQGGIVVSAWLA